MSCDYLAKVWQLKSNGLHTALFKKVGQNGIYAWVHYTRLTFLRIEIDTVALQLRLLQDKLDKLKTTLTQWMYSSSYPSPRRSGSKRELLSLIGLLSHAAKVVHLGRAFIRNLINASTTVSSLEHRVRLNSTAREDIA